MATSSSSRQTMVSLYKLSAGVKTLEHRVIDCLSQNDRKTGNAEVTDVLCDCVTR